MPLNDRGNWVRWRCRPGTEGAAMIEMPAHRSRWVAPDRHTAGTAPPAASGAPLSRDPIAVEDRCCPSVAIARAVGRGRARTGATEFTTRSDEHAQRSRPLSVRARSHRVVRERSWATGTDGFRCRAPMRVGDSQPRRRSNTDGANTERGGACPRSGAPAVREQVQRFARLRQRAIARRDRTRGPPTARRLHNSLADPRHRSGDDAWLPRVFDHRSLHQERRRNRAGYRSRLSGLPPSVHAMYSEVADRLCACSGNGCR